MHRLYVDQPKAEHSTRARRERVVEGCLQCLQCLLCLCYVTYVLLKELKLNDPLLEKGRTYWLLLRIASANNMAQGTVQTFSYFSFLLCFYAFSAFYTFFK